MYEISRILSNILEIFSLSESKYNTIANNNCQYKVQKSR